MSEDQPLPPRSPSYLMTVREPDVFLRFYCDGTIKIGKGLKPDEAGRQAIDAMRDQLSFVVQQARADAFEEAAKIADTGMLVPPDGGSPTEDECAVAERIAAAIRARKDQP